MHLFRVRKKGEIRFVPIVARNRIEAAIKLKNLVESRKILQVRDPQLRPGSLRKSRKIFRGE